MTEYHPLIAVPCRADESSIYPGSNLNVQNNTYINAVIEAGGIPILIPLQIKGDLLETVFQQVDGILFTGGGDIDPECYNDTVQVDNLEDVKRERDELEINLLKLAVQESKPFFAICRGIQIMNIAGGGNLWQDIASQCPEAMKHNYFPMTGKPRDYMAHNVTFSEDSLINKILGESSLMVNSLHHQALNHIPDCYRTTGIADDGIVEVLEAIDHPFGLGVQWHPEELLFDHIEAWKLFTAFIRASQPKS